MASLNVSTGQLKSVGQTIRNDGENFLQLLKKIDQHNENLQTAWQGSDAEKYTSKIEEQSKVMNDLAEAIDSIGLFLVQISEAYESAREEAKNSIN